MWKKEDVKPQAVPEISTGAVRSTSMPMNDPKTSREPAPLPVSPRATACLSQGLRIKGEITGSEDLFVDGQIEGRLNLSNASVTIGPNGNVKADVTAREVIVRGRIEGKIIGREKVHLWNTANVSGEVQTERLVIEDGATLCGKVEAGKVQEKSSETRKDSSTSGDKPSNEVAISSGTAAD
jgi:cytoskeletal protein CcmA (bactofilin family)